MKQPKHFSYFTQGESQYLDWSPLDEIDMSWVDLINVERKMDGEEPASKNLGDTEFPLSHLWSDDFKKAYDSIISVKKNKITEIVKTADEVVKIDEMTIYLDCRDGNHYFKTPYFNYGSIEVAAIDGESNFDSVDTAVYAFVNDYKEWRGEHGKRYDAMIKLSNLEALRQPGNADHSNQGGCQHEDLGSLGYRHGDTVKCPFCGVVAEVW